MKMDIMEMKEKCPWLEYALIGAATEADKNITNLWPKIPKHWDIKFIANGVELPVVKTFLNIAKQHEEMIIKKAKELISEKFSDLSDLITDLEERIKPEISKRLEDWEKDEN